MATIRLASAYCNWDGSSMRGIQQTFSATTATFICVPMTTVNPSHTPKWAAPQICRFNCIANVFWWELSLSKTDSSKPPGLNVSSHWNSITTCPVTRLWILKVPKWCHVYPSDIVSSVPFSFFFLIFIYYFLGGCTPQHMKVPRRGVESELQAAAVSLPRSHTNARSKLHLQPTPQLMAMLDL